MLIIFLIPLNTDDVFSDNFYTLNNEVDTDTAAQEENDSQGEIIVVTMEKYWHILQLPELRKLPVSTKNITLDSVLLLLLFSSTYFLPD